MRRWLSWGFLVFTIIIHVILISSLWTGSLNLFFHDTKFIVGQGADFFAYYQAGHNVLNGLGAYDIPDTLIVPYMYPYRYLPYFAYSFGVVINLVPPITAYWVWAAIVVGSVWLVALQTRSVAKKLKRPDWEWRLAMGMWFVFTPVYIELYVGQVTLVAGILLFFALTSRSLVEGGKSRWGTMTVFWTAGALTKLIPYFVAPAFLSAGRIRSVLSAMAITIVAIIAVPAGLEALEYFLNFNAARTFIISPYAGSHSLKMLLLILSGQSTSDFTLVTMALVGFFFIISICVTFYSRDVWSCAGLLSLSYFFIMTDVWEHHYTFILPFLVLAWIRGRPEDKARWVPFVLALLMSLPFMPLIEIASGLGAGAPPSTWSLGWRVLYHSSKVVPALIFYIWLLMTALRSPKADSLLEFYQNAWRDLVSGENPPIQAGIMVSEEIGIEERNSISQNGISV